MSITDGIESLEQCNQFYGHLGGALRLGGDSLVEGRNRVIDIITKLSRNIKLLTILMFYTIKLIKKELRTFRM